MPVDYSKWDNLELSDDSDIEVHPNVDKRSFIRAKQNQIHQERDHRRHQITTLKYERIINDGLMARIDRLLTALKSHKAEAAEASANPDELILQSLVESTGDPAEDQPPKPPAGVHEHVKEQPTYSKMMAALVDQVKKAVDESKAENTYEAYITEVGSHKSHVEDLQKQLLAKLAELEKEDKKHITSDDISYGFDYSNVAKSKADAASNTATQTSTTPELLNPGALSKSDPGNQADESTGAQSDDESDVSASPLGKKFAQIKYGDYRACQQFITEHPSLLTEKETDGLLVEGFNAQLDGKEEFARQCVHQALLLQYCRQLGRDGVNLFFKRITTPGHQANKLFTDDVGSTYSRIRTRSKEILAERAANPQSAEGVEQIQLHAVDPGTSINITIPPPLSDAQSDEEKASRTVFESFPPGLQRALESKSLDEVNKVLGKMSVDEAEEVVGKLSEGGMLSVEEGVIDATTEEGQKAVREIEQAGRMQKGPEGEQLSEDPPLD